MFRPRLLVVVVALAAILVAAPAAQTQELRFRLRRAPVVSGPAIPYAAPLPPCTTPAFPGTPVGSASNSSDNSLYEEVRRRAELGEAKEFSLFRAPTPPLKLSRNLPEWERARYLILAMPEAPLANRDQFKTYAGIMKHALEVTDVLVLINGNRPENLKRFVRLLEENKLQDKLAPAFSSSEQAKAAANQIHVVPLEVNTLWIRDYGPIFATTEAGKLCILDSMYRDLRGEQQKKEINAKIGGIFSTLTAQADTSSRNDDDRVPTILATSLGNRFLNETISVVRTPLQLSGGDFFTDGAGTGFISTDTLMNNGGDTVWVNRLLREYYGISRVIYLEALPGVTIKHIDMFFRPVDGNTFILADYPDDVPASSAFFDILHKEARQTLERNVDIIKRNYPNAKIVRVSMPPLQFYPDRTDMVRCSSEVVRSAGLDPFDYNEDELIEQAIKLGSKTETSRAKVMMQQVAAWRKTVKAPVDEFEIRDELRRIGPQIDSLEAKKRAGLATSTDLEDLKRLLARETDLSKELKLRMLDLESLYFTYANAVHLKGESKEKVLVPSYRQFQKMEQTVRNQFKLAYPNAEIVFIPADKFAVQFGALHCMTCVMPEHRPYAATGKGTLTTAR
jgi:agmatine/peptidylarginine deiminase